MPAFLDCATSRVDWRGNYRRPECAWSLSQADDDCLRRRAGGSSFMSALHDQPNPGTDDQADDEPRLVDTDPSVAELLSRASVNG